MKRGALLNRMFEAYGKEPTGARMYYYEEWAKALPVETVNKIIDNAVKDCGFLPTVKKLIELTLLAETTGGISQPNTHWCYDCQHVFIQQSNLCPKCGEVAE